MQSTRRRLITAALSCVVASLVSIHATAADATPSGVAPTAPSGEVIEFLLSTAAEEFRASPSVRAVAFRKVRVGYFAEGGVGRYVLCGRVQSVNAQKAEWIPFATIQTSPYEQWLGGVAESICASRIVKWYPGDHAADLLTRVGG